MIKKFFLFVCLLVCLEGSLQAQTKISCLSETGTVLGFAYFQENNETVAVYSEFGYLIGFIKTDVLPYIYYSETDEATAEVYINSSGDKAIFHFKE